MGHWLDNDRQAKHRVTNETKKEVAKHRGEMGDKSPVALSESTRSGPADERFAVEALYLPCVPTPVNV